MLRALLAVSIVFAAGPAFASAPPKEEKASGQFIDVSPAALPVIADGRLRNYVFVAVRVNLSPKADAQKLREKEPFLRDALVRAAHKTPFAIDGDYTRLDDSKIRSALLHEVGPILGAGMATSVEVKSQTPQRRSGLPQKRAAAAH